MDTDQDQEQEQGFTVPAVTPQELVEWLDQRADLLLVDVREPYEFPRARFQDDRVEYVPLSELARKHLEGLPEKVKQDRSTTLVIFCHHGIRSAQVARWLLDLGWSSVYNLSGGIDAYARLIDPRIGRY